MSSQKGNISRTRPQKHHNATKFKNNKYDTSKETKRLNTMEITSLCARCTSVIEWRIRYQKYKALTVPKKCVKCEGKCVKMPYHIVCSSCVEEFGICAKCCTKDLVTSDFDTAAGNPS